MVIAGGGWALQSLVKHFPGTSDSLSHFAVEFAEYIIFYIRLDFKWSLNLSSIPAGYLSCGSRLSFFFLRLRSQTLSVLTSATQVNGGCALNIKTTHNAVYHGNKLFL